MGENYKTLLRNIRCFIFDVDGVLTNGSLIVRPGELLRVMNIKDGYALKTAVDKGYVVAAITGGKSESVKKRLVNLGLKDIYINIENKTKTVKEIIKEHKLKKKEILYMGDDLPDYEAMKLAGVTCCPADAVPEIKNISSYVSPYKGGEGCVRDIIEQVMRLKGKWPVFRD